MILCVSCVDLDYREEWVLSRQNYRRFGGKVTLSDRIVVCLISDSCYIVCINGMRFDLGKQAEKH
jgi:hypothetical protein